MKAATVPVAYYNGNPYISIHAAREGGDLLQRTIYLYMNISIHAAREGGDYLCLQYFFHRLVFQSTPPVKAATLLRLLPLTDFHYFNPRRP